MSVKKRFEVRPVNGIAAGTLALWIRGWGIEDAEVTDKNWKDNVVTVTCTEEEAQILRGKTRSVAEVNELASMGGTD